MLSRGVLVLLVAAMAVVPYGCGSSGGGGAEQLAKQEELRVARQQAAQDARQSAKIEALERKLRSVKRQGEGSQVEAEAASPAAPVAPVSTGEPITGLWKGEAVIRYDNGEADPFNETIDIESLVAGEPAGYAEAHQGSTTCHGPFTYEGRSAGWYRFSAEERNVEECIDFSEIELMPTESGELNYRETTEVSVSTGRLTRVR